MNLSIDSFELLFLKVLVSDEITKLEQRVKFWKEDIVESDEDTKAIIEFNEKQIFTACKLYQKLLKCEV